MDRRHVIALVAACALFAAACGDDGGDSDEGSAANVTTSTSSEATTTTEAMDDGSDEDDAPGGTEEAATISGLTFQPDPIEVAVGTTVVWSNEDSVGHTVSAEDDSFSEVVDPDGGTASVTFDQAGEYDYFCGVHPQMTGTVVVS